MVTLNRIPFKVGESLKRGLETMPKQALRKLKEVVETGRKALRNGVEGTVRAMKRFMEVTRTRNESLFVVLDKVTNMYANQNVNATFPKLLVELKTWQHVLRNLVNSVNIQNGQRRASKTKVWACVETRDQTPERDESIVRPIQECIEAYRNDMLLAA